MTVHDLPAVNATLNGLSAVFLTLGFIFIRRGNQTAHRNCMISAFATSVVFLGCYLTYHATVKTVTHFTNPPEWRPVYLAILISHTILAAAIVPLILVTLAYRSERFLGARNSILSRLIVPAIILPVAAMLVGFLFGAPRTLTPHFNMADMISGGLLALGLLLGYIMLLLFKFDTHQKIARWTWPLWLYVSVTGVVIYWLLYLKFPQN